MRLRPKITPFSLQRQSARNVTMLGCLCSTVHVQTARRTNVKITTKPSASMKNLAKVTQDSIPVSKFDNDQVNHSLGTMKELRESTRKLEGHGIFFQPHQVHLRGGNHLKMVGRHHQVGMNSVFFLIPVSRCFAYRQWRSFCNRRGVTHAYVALPHTWLFLVAGIVVSQNSRSRIQVQHATRALVIVSFTLEHFFFFHMHSSPTFYPTISTPRSLLSTSHGELPCAYPSNVSFGLPWMKRTRLQSLQKRASYCPHRKTACRQNPSQEIFM